MAPRSQSDRAAERRRQKLELVQEQIRNGSLTVRQMSAEERGEPQRLAELERIAKGAADRLRRAQRAD